MTRLSKTGRFARLTSVFTVVGAAIEVSRAIDANRMPPAGALKTLGINEDEFRKTHIL